MKLYWPELYIYKSIDRLSFIETVLSWFLICFWTFVLKLNCFLYPNTMALLICLAFYSFNVCLGTMWFFISSYVMSSFIFSLHVNDIYSNDNFAEESLAWFELWTWGRHLNNATNVTLVELLNYCHLFPAVHKAVLISAPWGELRPGFIQRCLLNACLACVCLVYINRRWWTEKMPDVIKDMVDRFGSEWCRLQFLFSQ